MEMRWKWLEKIRDWYTQKKRTHYSCFFSDSIRVYCSIKFKLEQRQREKGRKEKECNVKKKRKKITASDFFSDATQQSSPTFRRWRPRAGGGEKGWLCGRSKCMCAHRNVPKHPMFAGMGPRAPATLAWGGPQTPAMLAATLTQVGLCLCTRAHQPAAHATQWPIGCSRVVGRGPQVGDPCNRTQNTVATLTF